MDDHLEYPGNLDFIGSVLPSHLIAASVEDATNIALAPEPQSSLCESFLAATLFIYYLFTYLLIGNSSYGITTMTSSSYIPPALSDPSVDPSVDHTIYPAFPINSNSNHASVSIHHSSDSHSLLGSPTPQAYRRHPSHTSTGTRATGTRATRQIPIRTSEKRNNVGRQR